MNFWLSAEVFSVSNKKERICFATGLLSLIKPYAYYGPVVFGIFQSAFSTVYYLEMISLASKKFTRGIWIFLIPFINLMYLPLDRSNGHVFILVTAFDKIIPILSTLFIKQHTLLGMTGGLITGGVIYTVTYKAVDLLGPIDNMKQFGVSRVI